VRKLAALLLVILFLIPASVAGATVTRAQLAQKQAEVQAKSAELEGRLGDLEAAMYQEWLTQSRIDEIQGQIADRQRQMAIADLAARQQAVQLYMNFGGNSDASVLGADAVSQAGTREAYTRTLVATGQDAVNQLAYLQQDSLRLQDQLQALLVEQAPQKAEMQAEVDQLMGELDQANQEYQALYDQWWREEQARIAAAQAAERARIAAAAAAAAAAAGYATSAGTPTAGRTCPVAGPNTFRDSWLEPRPGGRLHHGTDIVAAMGTPLVAIENGVIYGVGYHYLGGNNLYLRGDSTDIYYYAHLSAFAAGISNGVRVNKGQLIGYVGDTGDATVPHLHIGYQPAGGPLTNPYQLMVNLCR
jgi:murein DD-endopeptidase MepM/ murein hydrolase activator NlpD